MAAYLQELCVLHVRETEGISIADVHGGGTTDEQLPRKQGKDPRLTILHTPEYTCKETGGCLSG